MESACTYYNCMVQIMVILRECHGNHYRPGELARMSKDCFYAGLLPENCPMVVHLKDQPHTTPLDLLRALLEQEKDALTRTHYPPSTSARPSHPQSQQSITTDSRLLRKGMTDIQSTLPNWTPAKQRRCPRRLFNIQWYNGCPGKLVQWWVPHRPLASCWD